jgi:hypothetical protein
MYSTKSALLSSLPAPATNKISGATATPLQCVALDVEQLLRQLLAFFAVLPTP